jgi:hypothetical protein
MRYMYTFYKKPSNQRLDTATRASEIYATSVTDPYYVKVDDLVTGKTVCLLENVEQLEDWLFKLERDFTWSDKADKEKLEKPASAECLGKPVDTNLKTIAGAGKAKTSAVPPIAFIALGQAMQNGADKYGKFNWRGSEVTASVFYDAMMRHLQQWYSGEEFAEDSGVHHLAHLMAGAAIILDAQLSSVLIDDRNTDAPAGIDPLLYIVKQQATAKK